MRPVFTSMRQRLRRLSMVAFLAIFGLAFAPTISHAVNHAKGGTVFNEICSLQGMKQLPADVDDESGSSRSPGMGHLDHCPLCGLSANAMASSPVTPTLAPADLSQMAPALFLHAPKPLFAWASAQPRAPPAFS
jgi:hypothetical protein